MRPFITAILLSVSLLLSGTVQAINLDDLQQRFSQLPVQRAEFEQTRQISGFPQPLQSSGHIIIAQKQGLWWHQQQPFTLTLMLNESHMIQQIAGQPAQVITAASNPQMFQFNRLLNALFLADRTTLEQNFTLDFSDLSKNGWRLKLIPKTTPLNKLFSYLLLTGDHFLNSIEINDMQGDQSQIRFFNHQTQPLTDAELRHF